MGIFGDVSQRDPKPREHGPDEWPRRVAQKDRPEDGTVSYLSLYGGVHSATSVAVRAPTSAQLPTSKR